MGIVWLMICPSLALAGGLYRAALISVPHIQEDRYNWESLGAKYVELLQHRFKYEIASELPKNLDESELKKAITAIENSIPSLSKDTQVEFTFVLAAHGSKNGTFVQRTDTSNLHQSYGSFAKIVMSEVGLWRKKLHLKKKPHVNFIIDTCHSGCSIDQIRDLSKGSSSEKSHADIEINIFTATSRSQIALHDVLNLKLAVGLNDLEILNKNKIQLCPECISDLERVMAFISGFDFYHQFSLHEAYENVFSTTHEFGASLLWSTSELNSANAFEAWESFFGQENHRETSKLNYISTRSQLFEAISSNDFAQFYDILRVANKADRPIHEIIEELRLMPIIGMRAMQPFQDSISEIIEIFLSLLESEVDTVDETRRELIHGYIQELTEHNKWIQQNVRVDANECAQAIKF
jgi:hypothetical protein